jgi:type IV pilus assembly protein PilB
MPVKFGQLLLQANLIDKEQIEQALEYQRAHGGRLGEILCELGFLTNEDLTRTLGIKYGVATAGVDQLRPDAQTLALIPAEMARTHRIIPLGRNGSTLTCALVDPTRLDSINEVQFQTGCNLQPILVTPAVMAAALARLYPAAQASPAAPAAPPRVARVGRAVIIAELTRRLDKLTADKLEMVRRFLDSIE